MANKLNVLVGVALAQSVETDLNKQIRTLSANLNKISLKAEIDTKSINNALKNIDFSKADQSAKTLATTLNSKVSGALDKLGDKTENVVSTLNRAVAQARQLSEALNGIENVNIRANIRQSSGTGNSSGSNTGNSSTRRSSNSLAERWQNELEHINRQVEATTTRLRSQYGDLFDESEFREIYNISSQIDDILDSENANWTEIRNRIRQCNDEARIYQNNLAASARDNNLSERWYTEQSRMQRQLEDTAARLRSQYGNLFNESEFRRIYDINDDIVRILNTENASWEQIRRRIDQCNDEARRFRSELSDNARELREIENQAGLLNNTLGRFMQFYGLGEVFRGLKTATVSIVTNIKDIDTSMVELQKVTDETDYMYSKFLDDSADKAKELGITMTDYIDAVTNFARMDVGGFEAAQEVAKVANIMQQVSESLTADQASEYLISTMKGFGYEANNAIEIVDILNNLSNKYAITLDGLVK